MKHMMISSSGLGKLHQLMRPKRIMQAAARVAESNSKAKQPEVPDEIQPVHSLHTVAMQQVLQAMTEEPQHRTAVESEAESMADVVQLTREHSMHHDGVQTAPQQKPPQ